LRLDEKEVSEIILATNTTVEGEVTAHSYSPWCACWGRARICRQWHPDACL
jgi:recombinational DNA repair protein RecR